MQCRQAIAIKCGDFGILAPTGCTRRGYRDRKVKKKIERERERACACAKVSSKSYGAEYINKKMKGKKSQLYQGNYSFSRKEKKGRESERENVLNKNDS